MAGWHARQQQHEEIDEIPIWVARIEGDQLSL